MPKRPARCYTPLDSRPYVKKRTKRKRDLVRGVPNPKIRIFNTGNRKGVFPIHVWLIAKEAGQIRHMALEAARITANRYLEKNAEGKMNYHLRILIYPHHVLRENKMMAFAGADRIQDGMRRAFGKPTGTAARVRQGQKLILIRIGPGYLEVAKKALRRAQMKFPIPCHTDVEMVSDGMEKAQENE
ncbi:MAG: 50S ribosomal protein L16 [Promethearchaeota archaeon]